MPLRLPFSIASQLTTVIWQLNCHFHHHYNHSTVEITIVKKIDLISIYPAIIITPSHIALLIIFPIIIVTPLLSHHPTIIIITLPSSSLLCHPHHYPAIMIITPLLSLPHPPSSLSLPLLSQHGPWRGVKLWLARLHYPHHHRH